MSLDKELSLYHLGAKFQELLSQLSDPETGEVNVEKEAELNALFPSVEKKCIGVVQWIKKLEADQRELSFLKRELEQRQAAYDKEISRKEDYLITNMQRCQITEINCPQFTIKLRKNQPSTDIINLDDIPARFLKTKEVVKTETKPDKNAIKEEVLQTGIQVPGASVQQKLRIEISVDKL